MSRHETPVKQGEVIARCYDSGEAVRVCWQGSRAVSIAPSPDPPEEGVWLAPSLVDLQINGYGGVDFQQDSVTLEEALSSARQLRALGCTAWFLTLITDEWSRLTARLRRWRALREQSAELKCAIVGWHIEGPCLSPEPGFHGTHPPEWMVDPTPERIRELRVAAGNDPLLFTLAPERQGALDAIRLAVSLGIKVSLGHTNADAATLRAAVEAGARLFTHFGNACPVEMGRQDNILWRVFDTPGLVISLIPDTHHVSPSLFRLAHRVFGGSSVYYVSDAVAAAGMPPGRHTVGRITVDVGEDQIVRHPGSRQFAGSALRPLDGVFRAAAMLGCSWRETWPRFSEAPAKLLGLPAQRDWCLLRFRPPSPLPEVTVLERGPEVA